MTDGLVLDDMPRADEWAQMTVVDEKRAAFERDLYFREGWNDLTEAFGRGTLPMLRQLALLSLKPDALAGRRTETILNYISEHGFAVVGYTSVRQSRHSMRELWRYNWHVYPVDRLELSTVMHMAADTPILILADLAQTEVPATVRMSDLKGPADIARRRPDQLRDVLRPPNKVINFVHAADEPVDIPRELGILLAHPQRQRLIDDARRSVAEGADLREEALDALLRIEAATPANDFVVKRSLERLIASGVARVEDAARIERALATSERLRWDELLAIADPADPRLNIWDVVCLGSELLPDERPRCGNLLPEPTAADWARR
jgi:hypothetical protein